MKNKGPEKGIYKKKRSHPFFFFFKVRKQNTLQIENWKEMSRSVSYTIVGSTTPMSKTRTRGLINRVIRSLIQWWWQQRQRPRLPGTDQVKTGTWKKKKNPTFLFLWNFNQCNAAWPLRACVFDADVLPDGSFVRLVFQLLLRRCTWDTWSLTSSSQR